MSAPDSGAVSPLRCGRCGNLLGRQAWRSSFSRDSSLLTVYALEAGYFYDDGPHVYRLSNRARRRITDGVPARRRPMYRDIDVIDTPQAEAIADARFLVYVPFDAGFDLHPHATSAEVLCGRCGSPHRLVARDAPDAVRLRIERTQLDVVAVATASGRVYDRG